MPLPAPDPDLCPTVGALLRPRRRRAASPTTHDLTKAGIKMAPNKARVEAALKRLESKLGIDREGRSVWVWLLPPGIGLVTAAILLLMPGLSNGVGLPDRLTLAVFGLLVVTTIASIFLISFDN